MMTRMAAIKAQVRLDSWGNSGIFITRPQYPLLGFFLSQTLVNVITVSFQATPPATGS